MHASDVEQAEALLSRWGPEGQGKIGGESKPECYDALTVLLIIIKTLGGQIQSRIRSSE